MKISTFITMLLVVGLLLFVSIDMIKQSEDTYSIDVNTTDWEDQYDFANDINTSISPIRTAIDDITSEDTGWLEKVGSGFTGIISAVTFLPSLVWDMGAMGTNIITGIGTSMGIPGYMLFVFITMLTVWGIIKLVEFFQRWNI